MEKTTKEMEQHWGQQQEHEIKQQLESNGSTNGHQKWNNWDNEQKDGSNEKNNVQQQMERQLEQR